MSHQALENFPEAEALQASLETWRRLVEAELKGASFDKKLMTKTFEGITLKPLYTRADVAARVSHAAALSKAPGEAPYLRGRRSCAIAERRWEVAQEIAAASTSEFNAKLRADLMCGQDAVVLVAETPARPDGLRLDSAADLDLALDGVDVTAVALHLEAGPCARKLSEALLGLANKRGVSAERIEGSLVADPLAAWAVGGALPGTLAAAFDSLAAWTLRAEKEAPALRTIGVDARIWAEAGGTAVHELACALSSVVENLRALRARGVSLETALPRLRVTFSTGPQFLMETAKFRAWRLLLSRVVVALGGDVTLARRVTVHAATTRWNKTRLDPHVNMLRVTTEALAAVLGGVDALHIGPYDSLDGIGGGDAFSRRIARNVHALLAEEFGFTVPLDPAGGSWCIESLTDELARAAWAQFQAFAAEGGFASALRAGSPQKLVAAAAAEKAKAVGSRRLGMVGTNLYPNLKEKPLPAPAKRPCTGAWTEERIEPVAPFRAAVRFEMLRDAAAAYAQRTGKPPRVFLAKMGPIAQHKARADFTAGFFAPGGFEALGKQSFASAAEAARAAAESGAEVAVLCSTDDTYPELVPVFAKELRTARPSAIIVLAGLPADPETVKAYTAAGIDLFIHLRAPVEETLANLLKKIGALS